MEVYCLTDKPYFYFRYANFSKIPDFVSNEAALNRANRFNINRRDINFSLHKNKEGTYTIVAFKVVPCIGLIDADRMLHLINQFSIDIARVYEDNEIANAISKDLRDKKLRGEL